MPDRLRGALGALAPLLAAGVAVVLLTGPSEGRWEADGGEGSGPTGRAVSGVQEPGTSPGSTGVDRHDGASRPACAREASQRRPDRSGQDPRGVANRRTPVPAGRPSDGERLRALLRSHAGPLPEEVVATLLSELERACQGPAWQALLRGDATALAAALLSVWDQTGGDERTRDAVARCLSDVRADEAWIVAEVEERLTGSVEEDLPLLRALGGRRGSETARALTTYVLNQGSEFRLPPFAGIELDLAGDSETAPVLAEALRRATSRAQRSALLHLSACPGASEMVATLASYTGPDQPEEVRAEAFRALGRNGTGPAVAHLLEVSARGGPASSTANTCLSQMHFATPEASARLLAALTDSTRPAPVSNRLALVRALGAVGGAAAVQPIAGALDDPRPDVRVAAVRSLGRLGHASRPHVDTLLEMYGRGGEALQSEVVFALGGIGGPTAREALERLHRDEAVPSNLRQSARRSLKRLSRR